MGKGESTQVLMPLALLGFLVSGCFSQWLGRFLVEFAAMLMGSTLVL